MSRDIRSLFKDLYSLDLFTSQKLPCPVPGDFMVLDCRKVDLAFASDFRIRERLCGSIYNDPCLCFYAHHPDRQPCTFSLPRMLPYSSWLPALCAHPLSLSSNPLT